MEKIEIRLLDNNLSFENYGDELYVEGIVNQTEQWSNVLGLRRRFVEKIKKGVFESALKENQTIDFLCEHDKNKLLATTQNGSLELFEDEQGLKMRAKIIPTTYGKDTYELLKSGVIGNMSFGFKVVKDNWTKRNDGVYERTIDKLNLFEVSAVRNPAYPKTAISARGLELVEDVDIPEEIRNENQEQVVTPPEQPTVVEQNVSTEIEKPQEIQLEQQVVQQEQVTNIVEQNVDVLKNDEIHTLLNQAVTILNTIDINKINEIYDKVVVQTKEVEQNTNITENTNVNNHNIKNDNPVEKPDLSKYYNMLKQTKELK